MRYAQMQRRKKSARGFVLWETPLKCFKSDIQFNNAHLTGRGYGYVVLFIMYYAQCAKL
jgi:hypothetical protein